MPVGCVYVCVCVCVSGHQQTEVARAAAAVVALAFCAGSINQVRTVTMACVMEPASPPSCTARWLGSCLPAAARET